MIKRYLGKLLAIDADGIVTYFYKKYRRHQNVNFVEESMRVLEDKNLVCKSEEDREFKKYLLLDSVFKINKELSRDHHSKQISLYIKYDKSKLLDFLQMTDAYDKSEKAQVFAQ